MRKSKNPRMSSKKSLIRHVLILVVLLVGCTGEMNESIYNIAIEEGLNYFKDEDYEEAEIAFNHALDTKKDDKLAKSLLNQTLNYKTAIKLTNQKNYKEAKEKAEAVLDISDGSEVITEKARNLIVKIEEKSDDDTSKNLTFDDFKGYYLHFSDEDPSIADLLITIDEEEIHLHFWLSNYEIYEIISKEIKNNNLLVDYYKADDIFGDEASYGTHEYRLVESEDETMLISNNIVFYKVPYYILEKYDYTAVEDFMRNYTD